MFYILKIEYHRNSYNRTLFLLSNLFTQNNKGNYHASNTGNRPKKEGDVG